MKQLIYVKKRLLEWHDAPEPKLVHPTNALVRPFAVALCDLDNAFLNRDLGKLMSAAAKAHYLGPRILKDLGPTPSMDRFLMDTNVWQKSFLPARK